MTMSLADTNLQLHLLCDVRQRQGVGSDAIKLVTLAMPRHGSRKAAWRSGTFLTSVPRSFQGWEKRGYYVFFGRTTACAEYYHFLKSCFSISISSRNPKKLQTLLRNTQQVKGKIKYQHLFFMYATCKKWNHILLKCIVTFLFILTFQKIEN